MCWGCHFWFPGAFLLPSLVLSRCFMVTSLYIAQRRAGAGVEEETAEILKGLGSARSRGKYVPVCVAAAWHGAGGVVGERGCGGVEWLGCAAACFAACFCVQSSSSIRSSALYQWRAQSPKPARFGEVVYALEDWLRFQRARRTSSSGSISPVFAELEGGSGV